ncbi:peptidylprolyl isomerase [Polaribacter porphyrae]|uniref:Peptidylprolyl isomerase n=1 Tax=Polaribacter porphyrae TaxID=1137780 RepID=A0A2S7WMB9_9FLAO|nr:peptidylprolyl isomerase [Polaribacter porphyrae]PQJ78748.1 peptidylprolyl isomerase [Polaribacter porphyrae]
MKKLVLLLVLGITASIYSQKKDKVLVTIDGDKTFISEFKRVYEKNLDAIDNEEAKDVEKNLELFINYKLKVKEAYAIKLDTLTSYRKEIETYRNQLSAPYLQDSAYVSKMVKDAYYRTKNEIKAKHILIRTPKVPTPKDTLEAFNKITKIRNRIVNGEDFAKVAEEVSEDPSARDNPKNGRKGNKGNLGYFSAFKMLFSFEDVAYNTKIGDVSKPFRTSYGYHILQVDAIRPSRGEVEVAHVLITDKTKKGEKLINEIYSRLEKNEQFKALARKYSDDTGSKSKGGKLRKFGTGAMIKEFEEASFGLEKEGSYTKPFKTRYGWHIVQLIKKHPVAPFKEMERELRNKVKSGTRAQLSKKAVINKLKGRYSIKENNKSKSIFDNKNIRTITKDSLQDIILIINEENFTQNDFVSYIKNRKNKPVYELFKEFKEAEILNYYKENLEKVEPDFANTLQEYRDGLLLFELMQQKIWEKSSKDTLGLKSYFNANLENYKTKELKKIKGQVMNDYQNHLEKNWIADLRNKSAIEIDKRQLKKLIKFYKKE